MKKQDPGHYYGYGGYPSTSTGRSTQGGSSNLPSIFDTSRGGGGMVMSPLRNRPPSGLQLDVKRLPNAGLFLPTTPRERADRGGRLCSSDATSDRIHQVDRLHTSQSTRHGRCHSQPSVPLHAVREKAVVGGASAALAVLTRRLPSGVLRGGTLPPIGAEAMDSGFTSNVTEEDDRELDSVFGVDEREDRVGVASESGTDDSDSDDEVSRYTLAFLSSRYWLIISFTGNLQPPYCMLVSGKCY